jgi:radical SAM protein with 4Fe4S-binding SPASM domain
MGNFDLQGPIHIDFNLTNACNLNCRHCHSSSGVKLNNELGLKEILKITTELHELGALSIAFAGGEPFARPDIIEILGHACSLPGWSVAVITNGTFFTRRVVEGLSRNCPNLTVNISLDGSSAQNLSVLREQRGRTVFRGREDLFEKIVNGIRAVIDAGLKNSVNFTLTKATILDCLPTYRLVVDELKAGGMVAIKFFPGGFGKSYLREFEIPYPLWHAEFTQLTLKKLNGELPGMQISVPAAWEFYLPLIDANIDLEKAENAWGYRSPLRERGYRHKRTIGEVAGVAELAIAGNGLVYPSVLFVGAPGMACGDLRLLGLKEIWESSATLRRLRSLDIKDIGGGCDRCKLKDLCGGGSRSRAYTVFNSITGKDYLCPILPELDSASENCPSSKPVLIESTSVEASASSEPRITVWGEGSSAIRIFRRQEGCEIRVSGYVIRCNEDLATLLDPYCALKDGAAAFGLNFGGTDAKIISNLFERLNELVGAKLISGSVN